MRVFIFMVVCVAWLGATDLARAAECAGCAAADRLIAGWAGADTTARRIGLMKDSYVYLKERVANANSPEDVGAVVRTLGAIYARDYDPLNDLLALYRDRLADVEYRRVFEDEVARLEPEAREKVKAGLGNLAHRPRCTGRGKSFVCS